METELSLEQQVPSGVLTGINISILNDTDAVSIFTRVTMPSLTLFDFYLRHCIWLTILQIIAAIENVA